jgi:transposase
MLHYQLIYIVFADLKYLYPSIKVIGRSIFMNELKPPIYSAYIGIDWADSKHDICLLDNKTGELQFTVIEHRVDKIEEWVNSLRKQFSSPIAIAVELSKGPIISALQKYDCFVIFPINPLTLAKYRVAFTPSRAKDDPTDAELALNMLRRYPERFNSLKPQSIEMRTLASLVEKRRSLVDDKTRMTNRLRSSLKEYYPQILEWFDHIDTKLFCDFLTRWPTVLQAKRARQITLTTFFNNHNMRFKSVLKRRLDAIKSSSPLTFDESVIMPYRMQALVLAGQLSLLLKSIEEFDVEIDKIAKQHDDYSLFSVLPGAGSLLTPRLMVAFGEQRERYKSAADFQKFSGIAPVTERSGKKSWVHWRLQCPTFLRQTLVEWAAQTINKSFWAEAYYRQQRAKGSSHQMAVRALAFKWIRILFKCWQTKTPYNEIVYLKALKIRGSSLLQS